MLLLGPPPLDMTIATKTNREETAIETRFIATR